MFSEVVEGCDYVAHVDLAVAVYVACAVIGGMRERLTHSDVTSDERVALQGI